MITCGNTMKPQANTTPNTNTSGYACGLVITGLCRQSQNWLQQLLLSREQAVKMFKRLHRNFSYQRKFKFIFILIPQCFFQILTNLIIGQTVDIMPSNWKSTIRIRIATSHRRASVTQLIAMIVGIFVGLIAKRRKVHLLSSCFFPVF